MKMYENAVNLHVENFFVCNIEVILYNLFVTSEIILMLL